MPIISPTAISPHVCRSKRPTGQPKTATQPEAPAVHEVKKASLLVTALTWFKHLIHK